MSQSNAHVVRFDNSKKNAKQAALMGRTPKPPRDTKQGWKRTDTKRMQFAGENE